LEVVVNDNLSWRMLLIVSPGLTFWTGLPRVTIIATSLVVLLQFLLRTRRTHVSRIEKGSLLTRMNPSPKLIQLTPNRNTTSYYPPPHLFLYPSDTLGTLGSVEGLVLLGLIHGHIFCRFLWVVIVGVLWLVFPLFLPSLVTYCLTFHSGCFFRFHPIAPDTTPQPRVH